MTPGTQRRRAVPTGTYRLQVTPAFTLDDAARVVPYLADLGVSHAYSSPLLQSLAGSDAGYDTVDHDRVDESRGGLPGLTRFGTALHAADLGLVLDVVPNHMGVGDPTQCPWWWDVLANGPASPHAVVFDIDWGFGGGKVRIPVLAGPDDVAALELGELAGAPVLRYAGTCFPVAAGTAGGTAVQVHARQHYELVDWRRGDTDLNYRRFFAIDTLAGIRVEDPAVFTATHRLVLRLVRDGVVDGLRIDHVDGLADPRGYLERLAAATGRIWTVVEKILEPGERLPASWPIAGTTGYDALAEVSGIFVDPAGEATLSALDHAVAGGPVDYPRLVHDCKLAAARGELASQVARLLRAVGGLPGAPADERAAAVAELLAAVPVYRSYLPDGAGHLRAAFAAAREQRPDLSAAFDALYPVLAAAGTEAATRFEQTSGPVMAKGVEDAAYYRWTRFVALNEVGGDPTRFGGAVADFHAAQLRRLADAPAAMTTLSTHDTKRSEDVRARLFVLAEIPGEWADLVLRWLDRHELGDRPLAHLIWQNLVGSWPLSRERARAFAEKAAREAGVSTSWTEPDAGFEERLAALVDAAYDDPRTSCELAELVARVEGPGWSNSLGQKLVQLTMPGVPDVYQGSELWDLSLVDPDNRRPVDFDRRRRLLAGLDAGVLPGVDRTGAAKLLVVSRALRLRRDHPEAFTTYRPVPASGPAGAHVVAFDRGGVVAVATRLPVGLARTGWADTTLDLPAGSWRDELTGETFAAGPGGVRLARLLDRLPVALLCRR